MASSQAPESSSKWFRQGYDPGTIITFDTPDTSRWKIIESVNEHDRQLPEAEIRNKDYITPPSSYASILLLCQDEYPFKKAFVRIYCQVPWTNSEMDDPQTRAKQAVKKFTPVELTAYQALLKAKFPNAPRLIGWKAASQGKNDLVPGGFRVSLVWEKVPGLRLGGEPGNPAFWNLPQEERDLIRVQVIERLGKLIDTANLSPTSMSPSTLVWDRKEKKIYFVGFRESRVKVTGIPSSISQACWRSFGLVNNPNSPATKKENIR